MSNSQTAKNKNIGQEILAEMEYNRTIANITLSTKPQKCFQCNSELILVKSWEETLQGGMFPQVITIYRCSNKECQEEKDKQEVKRKEAVKDKESRMEAIAKVKAERKVITDKEKEVQLKIVAKERIKKAKEKLLNKLSSTI